MIIIILLYPQVITLKGYGSITCEFVMPYINVTIDGNLAVNQRWRHVYFSPLPYIPYKYLVSSLDDDSTPVAFPESDHARKALDDTYIGIIIGTLCALILLLAGIAAFFIIRRRRSKYSSNPLKVFGSNLNDLTYGLTSAKVANGNCYNAVSTGSEEQDKDAEMQKLTNRDTYMEPIDSMQNRKLPEIPGSQEVAENGGCLNDVGIKPYLVH